MFAFREKESSKNEHHQKSHWERPSDAVCHRSLHEGASGPEKTQTGKDAMVSEKLLRSDTIKHQMSQIVVFSMLSLPIAFRGRWRTPGTS